MDKKVIAVVAIVILVIAGAGIFLALKGGDSGSDEYRSDDDTGRLKIFGNADNNDYLDNDDVKALQKIIKGEMEKTPFADANQDGKVDSADVDFVKRMVNREKMTIYYLNNDGVVKSAHYPETTLSAIPNTTLALMKSIGATNMIKAISGGNYDKTMFGDLMANAEVISSSMTTLDLDKALDLKIDCVVVDYSSAYLKDYEKFEKAGIDVVRIDAAGGLDSLDWALTVGYLCGIESSSQDFVKWSDEVYDDIQKGISKVNKKVTTLAVTMTNSVAGTEGSAYATSVCAGAINLADFPTSKKAEIGDEWILSEKYSSQFIAHTCNYSFSTVGDAVDDLWEKYKPYFKDTDAYKAGHYFIFNSNVPNIIRVAYQVEMYYPEVFADGYASKLVQEWIDKFIPSLKDFKVGRTVSS
ncbi:MAG: ABC transporter substrate-binding protein [Candidatus Methanomethylophilaceae archaeon]|nr:ABC transporter substrate-binding protein [Candidatus Methanomethylophilaceae archaeon]